MALITPASVRVAFPLANDYVLRMRNVSERVEAIRATPIFLCMSSWHESIPLFCAMMLRLVIFGHLRLVGVPWTLLRAPSLLLCICVSVWERRYRASYCVSVHQQCQWEINYAYETLHPPAFVCLFRRLRVENAAWKQLQDGGAFLNVNELKGADCLLSFFIYWIFALLHPTMFRNFVKQTIQRWHNTLCDWSGVWRCETLGLNLNSLFSFFTHNQFYSWSLSYKHTPFFGQVGCHIVQKHSSFEARWDL